ncbi:MAG TPA: LITAF-like zinc ribbon domain-containing protein [Pyrinomonadaceae bacterium]|jgi:RNA polymerase subunit RPABC4/transcription elongation factor Spt4
MSTCNKCGRVNDESARICRFCGTVLEQRQARATGTLVRDYTPPGAAPSGVANAPQPVAPYSPPGVATGGYRCPHCGSTYPPIAEKRISTEGWVVFAALLIFCLPLFWIGLLMKEELRLCPMCRARLA